MRLQVFVKLLKVLCNVRDAPHWWSAVLVPPVLALILCIAVPLPRWQVALFLGVGILLPALQIVARGQGLHKLRARARWSDEQFDRYFARHHDPACANIPIRTRLVVARCLEIERHVVYIHPTDRFEQELYKLRDTLLTGDLEYEIIAEIRDEFAVELPKDEDNYSIMTVEDLVIWVLRERDRESE